MKHPSLRHCLLFALLTALAGCSSTDKRTSTTTQPSTVVSAETDIIAYALAQRGLTRETARLDPQTLDTLASQQRMVQPHFVRYWKNPYDFPKFANGLLKEQERICTSADKGIFELFALSQVRAGYRAATRWDFAPEMKPDKDAPVEKALETLAEKAGAPLADARKTAVTQSLKGAPPELQTHIAKLLMATTQAKTYRDRGLRNYPKEKVSAAFDYALRSFRAEETADEAASDADVLNWDLGQLMDFDDLYTGAGVLLRAVCELQQFLTAPQTEAKESIDLSRVAFEFDTPLGRVSFNGKAENNQYRGDDYLLIVDLAGDDTYTGATAASYALGRPVSVVIDWAGNDTYTSGKETLCSQGAGVFGYGILIDNGGDDTFTAVNYAQGACYFGVGLLWARGGNDKFTARALSQGAAAFGVANLVKIGGNDSYYAYFVSQGFGFVGGYGTLIDTDGDDKYVAEPYDLVRAAKGGHDTMRNYTFCQGAGWGQRGDLFGGHSMAGGTGVLQDLGGNDHYECGVYGQATGYWYGTGILHDKSGNDHYEGSFFVQSGTAHMGLTLLLDESGDDTYHVWRAISQAGAHDFSVSIFIDKAGNDKLSAWSWKDEKGARTLKNTGTKGDEGGTLIGSAINNSIAIYINLGGDDTYEFYSKDSFGWSNQNGAPGSWRRDVNNIALFLDIGGNDTYNCSLPKELPPDWGKPANNHFWTRSADKVGPPERNFSLGLDVSKGRVPEANP